VLRYGGRVNRGKRKSNGPESGEGGSKQNGGKLKIALGGEGKGSGKNVVGLNWVKKVPMGVVRKWGARPTVVG